MGDNVIRGGTIEVNRGFPQTKSRIIWSEKYCRYVYDGLDLNIPEPKTKKETLKDQLEAERLAEEF